VGKQSHRTILTLEERKLCYQRAQHELEDFSNEVALHFASDKDADRIAAVFTPDYRRPDNLQGVFQYLYLVQIADALRKDLGEQSVRILFGCPSWFIDCLKGTLNQLIDARPLKMKLPCLQTVTDIYGILRFIQAPYPRAIISRRDGAVSRPTSASKRTILLKIPEAGALARYGNLVEELESHGFSVVGEDFDREEIRNLDEAYLRTARKVPFFERLRTILQVIRLRARLNRVCKKLSREALKRSPIFSPSTFGLARRFTQIKSLSRAIVADRFAAFICVSSLTKPADRLLFAKLKRLGIPAVLVFPRPVTKYRPAECPLAVDLDRPDTLPEYFIVRDESSKSKLSKAGLSADRIHVGSPSMLSQKTIWPGPDQSFTKQIIVLLPASEPDNVGLIRDLNETASNHPDLSLLVKGHPNSGLRASEILALERLGLVWTDSSQSSMESIIAPCALAVTSCSTSVIEASLQGAGVVWAPLYSELAMPQMEFMEHIGLIAESEKNLSDILDRLLSDDGARRKLALECHDASHRLHASESTISRKVIELLDRRLEGNPKAYASVGECE